MCDAGIYSVMLHDYIHNNTFSDVSWLLKALCVFLSLVTKHYECNIIYYECLYNAL